MEEIVIIELVIGKFILKSLHFINRKGGSLPGKVTYKISKNILKKFKLPKYVILITGTNGKTSITNMVYSILKDAGVDVASNCNGDNIVNGIVSLLIRESDLSYKIKREALVIEIDELTLANQLKNIKASHIVIGNFFRDQLDRAGEMESIITKIGNSLRTYDNELILNIDDPNVYRLKFYADKANIKTFGVDKTVTLQDNIVEAKEGKFCPNCDSELIYDYYHYSHIGKYHCSKCDFKRENPTYEARDVNLDNGNFKLNGEVYNSRINAFYNIYNLVEVYSIINELNIDTKYYKNVLDNFKLELGRMEILDKCLLNLVKNPTGANEVIRFIKRDSSDKCILFLLNDNVADGHDISWIWDVEVSDIIGLKTVICTGTRAYEMAIRFKYANFEGELIVEENLEIAVNKFYNVNLNRYAISNYTGLLKLREELINGN